MYLLTWLIVIVLALWAFERFYLRGGAVRTFPAPADPQAVRSFKRPGGPGPEHEEVEKAVRELTRRIAEHKSARNLPAARAVMDELTMGRRYVSRFIPAEVNGRPAEWVLAPGAAPHRRMLYIHGGGFIMGSPKSHRTITSKFSEVSSCAVLAVDYRLMPEHSHMDGLKDCRDAYRWILDNGPDGPHKAETIFVGGDSAGGNFCLSLVAWLRDKGMRLPDAVVALSPLTDLTVSGATIRSNEASDTMLKKVIGPLNRLPRFAQVWLMFLVHRMRPAGAVASPLFGDLSGLPPTLVQASEAEMLYDDARRYVFKARASGSPAILQTWADVVHVWQIFDPLLPQAREAWREIGKFLEAH